jgi:hypothetical protein
MAGASRFLIMLRLAQLQTEQLQVVQLQIG